MGFCFSFWGSDERFNGEPQGTRGHPTYPLPHLGLGVRRSDSKTQLCRQIVSISPFWEPVCRALVYQGQS
jgi:hypothetical protein